MGIAGERSSRIGEHRVYENILCEKADGIATITLNRPDVMNAYTPDMGDELVTAFNDARADETIRVVILTGSGRGFCAGADRAYLRPDPEGKLRPIGAEEFVTTYPIQLATFPKPIIVAINGAAVGIGVTMTLPCDIRIAAEDARISLNFAKLGILMGLGSTHLLPQIVGRGTALELVLTAPMLTGREAAAVGLVNRAVPGDRLIETARAMAAQVIECNADAIAYGKRALHYGSSATLEDAIANEKALNAERRKAHEAKSGR
jgi:2-(1,2-epoxy-1,2-dihydrophenyl)acetyl-CoA isomerase